MRNRRGVAIGALLLSAMAVVVASTALTSSAAVNSSIGALAAAPAAPYSFMSLDGRDGSYQLRGTRVFETISGSSGTNDYLGFYPNEPDSGAWSVVMLPPSVGRWEAKTYSVARALPKPTDAWISVSGEGKGCNQQSGTMTVHELERTAGLVSVFAATFTIGCENIPNVMTGEIRWNSTVDYVAALTQPSTLDYEAVNVPKTVTFTGKGSKPLTFGPAVLVGSSPDAFTINGDSCSLVTLNYGDTCSVTITTNIYSTTAGLAIPDNSAAGKKYVSLTAGLPPPPPTTTPPTTPPPTNPPSGSNVGTFYQLPPSRILDTRYGNGAGQAPLGQDSTLGLQVAGRGGVPSSGVSAAVLNVTTTGATGDSYLTVWPSGVAKPTASSLNFVRGWEGANSVTVPVGSDGKVNIYNHVGSTHVIADVVGYYAADSSMVNQYGSGGNYQVVTPERLFDSREDWGEKLPAGYSVRVAVNYGSANNSHIRALVVNVTSVDADGPGYLSTWNGLGAPPSTSTLNYVPGATVPNLAVVPVSWCDECGGFPAIGVYTHQSTNVVVDIMGVFDDGTLPDGLRFTPRTPQRIVDTRLGLGSNGPIGQFGTAAINPPIDVTSPETWALAMNVTAVTPSALTFLTVYPTGVDRPTSSNLNPAAGQTVPNAVYGLLGPTSGFSVYNNTGSVGLVVDVVGTFVDARTVGGLSSPNSRSLSPSNKKLSLGDSQPDPRLQSTG